MMQQAAKANVVIDLREEGVGKQLQFVKEDSKPGPCKVVSKRRVLVLGQEKVYTFRSRAPSTSVHWRSEGSLELSRTSALAEEGKAVETLPKSTRCWVQQEPARCWVRGCTGMGSSAAGHPSRTPLFQHTLLGEEDSLTQISEEFLSKDEGNDGSVGKYGTTSFQACITGDDASRSLAEEYSLAPLNMPKKYSAWSFDQQVENYFKQL